MSLVEELRPKALERIMDLVARAGVNTSEWGNYDGGASRAAANPKFCYEWAFVEPGAVVVVNLAHRDIVVQGGKVQQTIELPDLKRRYADGNALRLKRLDRLAQALEVAYRTEVPIRAVIFDGDLADENTSKPTRVSARELDPVPWAVTSCSSAAGVYTLTRGASSERFVDQFTVAERSHLPPERRAVVTVAFERRADVRRRARQRANGKCEFCGQEGFVTPVGEIYLETHHVVPLSEDGLDTDDNVVALCANHHREAHLGGNRSAMRSFLLHLVTERSSNP